MSASVHTTMSPRACWEPMRRTVPEPLLCWNGDDPHVREAGRRLLQPGEGPVGRAVVDGQQLVGLAAGVHRLADALDLVDHVVLLVVAGQDDRDVHRRRRRIAARPRPRGRARAARRRRAARARPRPQARGRGLGGGLGRRLGRLGAHAARGYSPGRAGTATRPSGPVRASRPSRTAARSAAPRPSRSGLPVARRLARRAPPRPLRGGSLRRRAVRRSRPPWPGPRSRRAAR